MGRIVVITGGTSGIGLGLKNLFEQSGDTVLTFSIDEVDSLNHYVGSVDHEIKVRQVFNDVYEKYGHIDILINCAGIGMSGITELSPIEEIQRVVDINYYGTLHCIRAALPHMAAGARIINMSSAMALFPVPFRSIYGSIKSAILNLSFGLRMELSQLGIEVTAMCPGNTKTNFTRNRIKDYTTDERYGDLIRTATEANDRGEDKRMSCDEVVEKIFKKINGKKLKPFYIIGGKYKFLYFLTRFTPKALLLSITNKKYGGQLVENQKRRPKPVKKVEEPTLEETTTTPVAEPVVTQHTDEPVIANAETTTKETIDENTTNTIEEVTTAETTEEAAAPETTAETALESSPSQTAETKIAEAITPVEEDEEDNDTPAINIIDDEEEEESTETASEQKSDIGNILSRMSALRHPDNKE